MAAGSAVDEGNHQHEAISLHSAPLGRAARVCEDLMGILRKPRVEKMTLSSIVGPSTPQRSKFLSISDGVCADSCERHWRAGLGGFK